MTRTLHERRARLAGILRARGLDVEFWGSKELAFDPDIRPGLIVRLRALGDSTANPDALAGWVPRVTIQRDWTGTNEEGHKQGRWILWALLFRAGLLQTPPPSKWQSVDLAAPTQRRRKK